MKTIQSQKWFTPAQQFYKEHLYSTFFGALVNDEIEQKLFGPIDDNGSFAITWPNNLFNPERLKS